MYKILFLTKEKKFFDAFLEKHPQYKDNSFYSFVVADKSPSKGTFDKCFFNNKEFTDKDIPGNIEFILEVK